jgi:signal peptidase I
MSPEIPTPSSEAICPTEPLLRPVACVAPHARPFAQRAGQGLLMLVLAAASYFVVSHFLLQSVKVVGVSMAPTLHDSEYCLLNRWVLYAHAPHRSDIVVIRDPLDQTCAVKRVVAVGGDSVYLSDGALCVNGQKVEEPYLPSGTRTFPLPPLKQQVFMCAKDQFFVLGDNRNYSLDSRSYGPISRQNILGLIIR